MEALLTLLSGVAWTLVYIDAIRIGLKDKSYAMPMFALGLNLGWELLYAYNSLMRSADLSLQGVINACWALFDLGIVYTYFRYGRRYWPPALLLPGACLSSSPHSCCNSSSFMNSAAIGRRATRPSSRTCSCPCCSSACSSPAKAARGKPC